MRVQTTRGPASHARSSSAGASLRRARRGLNIGREEAVSSETASSLLWASFRGTARYESGPVSFPYLRWLGPSRYSNGALVATGAPFGVRRPLRPSILGNSEFLPLRMRGRPCPVSVIGSCHRPRGSQPEQREHLGD